MSDPSPRPVTPSPEPLTEAGRRAVEAIKGGALALWADDPDDPIAAMIAAVEREALALPSAPDHRLREALLDILEMSKGEPRMGGGATFMGNAHRMGRIHNRARQAFGEAEITILPSRAVLSEATPSSEPALDVGRLAKALRGVDVLEGYAWEDDVPEGWRHRKLATAIAAEYRRLSASQTPEPGIK